MAFLFASTIPILLLSSLFYAGFKAEMRSIQANTRKEVWDSITERARGRVEAAGRLAETKLLYWRDRLEAIVSLVGTIYRHPEDYMERKMLWSPFGFFYTGIESTNDPGLFYAPSSRNILPITHFSRFSYVAPLLASTYKTGDIDSVWIVLRNRAYIIYPGLDHEKRAKDGKLDLETMLSSEPSIAIVDFSEGEASRLDPVYLDLYGGGYLACFRVPIRLAGKTLGAVGIDIRPEKLLQVFDVEMLIDPKGHVITQGRSVLGGIDPSSRQTIGNPLRVQDVGISLKEGAVFQNDRFIALKKMGDPALGWWMARVETPKSLSRGLFDPKFLSTLSKRFLGYIRNVFIIGLFLSIVLTLILSSRILEAFDRIRKNLLKISEGKFESVPKIKPKGRKNQDELSRLLTVTSDCAAMIAKQIREIESFSNLDPLTHLCNRRPLYALMESKTRKGALILLDIDHFKHVNDTYGHRMGDRVIEHIAQVLRSNTRDADMTVRWGGEEFLVYLPRTSKEKAVLIAERLRHNTAAEPVEGILVTISLGVAEGILNQELIQKADEALITAKQSGRNRVVID